MLGVTSVAVFRWLRRSITAAARALETGDPFAQPAWRCATVLLRSRFEISRTRPQSTPELGGLVPKTGLGSPSAVDAGYSRRAR
jgi:hypothetical protein